MVDILKDSPPVFGAYDEIAVTKTNNTPKTAAQSNEWVTAQHGNFVDNAMKAVNSWLFGDRTAGTAGKTAAMDGAFQVAENAAFGGALPADSAEAGIAVGSKAVNNNGITLQALQRSTLRFGSATKADNGSLSMDHTTGTLTLRADDTDVVSLTASALLPAAHLGRDLGSAAVSWREVHAETLMTRNVGQFGTGGSAIDLKLNGGTSVGQEPQLSFQENSITQVSFKLEDGALRMEGLRAFGSPSHTTVERDALVTPGAGDIVWNTDNTQLEIHNGTVWGELTATGGFSTVTSLTDTTISGAAVGQTLTWNGSAWVNQTPPTVASVSRDADCLAGDAVGDCVYITGPEVVGKIQVAQTDVTDSLKMPACGIIISKPTSTTAVVHSLGLLDTSGIGIAGMTPGKPVFVGSSNRPSSTAPAVSLSYVQEIGLAHNSAKMVNNPTATILQNP